MKTAAQIEAMWPGASGSTRGARSNPARKRAKTRRITVRKSGGGYTFCRTVSKAETKQIKKAFSEIRKNPAIAAANATKSQALHNYAVARRQYQAGNIPLITEMEFRAFARAHGASYSEIARIDKKLSVRSNPGCAIDGRFRGAVLARCKRRSGR